jgi:hypothetical protein
VVHYREQQHRPLRLALLCFDGTNRQARIK